MNPIRAALGNRSVVYVLTAFAVLLGLRALLTMPRREDPKVTIRTGLVAAVYPGATARQVEEQVARRIEERLFRHAEVRKRKTFSTSRDGVVIVTVELEESVTDPDRFWAMLRHDMNELRATELPATVQGPVVNASFGDVVAVLLAVRGDRYAPAELRTYLDRIEDAMRTIPDVSRVNRTGEQREELRVTTSNARLAQFGVTVPQVAGAIRARNAVQDAGGVDAADGGRVPMRATGLFDAESELQHLLVATSRDGRPVYLGDFAGVERRTADPSLLVRVDGRSAALIAVEMQDGRNIVAFGDEVRAKLAELRRTLPTDLRVDLIADQPAAVQDRMLHFGREFLITLGAVILVTVLLLPLRVAAIAAVAIPITVAITIAILAAVGIELHQVTFAGLVVALGIVVDDAIVVVDAYLEKLDHGVAPLEAAWRAPTELAVPVLAATLTIVASFLPIAYLPGAPGEFIRAMSFTVAIALMVSFAVAMLLTPILSLLFAKAGLHRDDASTTRRFSPLDAMQRGYERVMALAMPRKRATLVGAVLAFVAGVALMGAVPYRFFPLNERAEFIVDVWMPAGTRLAGTDAVVRRLETEMRRVDGVRRVASFVGAGAPRFYYNLNPEPPTPNYGELVVTTASPEATNAIVARLQSRLDRVAPEAWVYVKPLQQGPVIAAPIEVRLVGDDLVALRDAGDAVARIFESTAGSAYVHSDWRDDEMGLAVHLKNEVAGRLGITDADVAAQLAAGFQGAPISRYWEGERDLDITLRLDEAERTRLDDPSSAYVASPTTGARVPLREVATVAPEWRPSRIVRRNGVRTLTVRSFSVPGVLPSVVLKAAQPRLAALALPAGVRLEQGGELEGSAEVQGAVNLALLTSMVGVFLILLFQFRNARQPLVVMVSIPLALVGAALGLVMTANPFTYTANLGVNALSGIVVRNAIILVDFANVLRAQGLPIEEAALLAGRRRLRPIFLTTMAAALGVTPMILSRSPLWSPMASVIAVGLVVSMVFTLVVVPVLYVVVERRVARRAERRTMADSAGPAAHGIPWPSPARAALGTLLGALVALVALVALGASSSASAQTRLTLDDAVALAQRQGALARVAGARVDAAAARRRAARADYLPTLGVTGNRVQGTERTTVTVPRGVLGSDAGGSPVPFQDGRFDQGVLGVSYAQVTLTQPVTQLYKIRRADALAAAATRTAEAERARTALDVQLGVERLFLGALAAREKARAAELAVSSRKRELVDAEGGAAAGTLVHARAQGARAAALAADYALAAARDEAVDLEGELRDAVGLAPDAPIALVPPAADPSPLRPLAEYVAAARTTSPDVAAAQARLDQAREGVALARASYVPDIGVGVSYLATRGLSFLPRHSATLSVQGSWTAWDFGKRGAAAQERAADAQGAEIALDHARARAALDVEKAYRRAERARLAAEVARSTCEARTAALRVATDQERAGLVVAASRLEAEAAQAGASADVIAAELDARVARAELERAAGSRR